MDPLTHTLVGANLATTRLGQKTRLATAALVLGANLPDVDSILYFTGHDDLALWFRRGWTHGVLAIVVLPFILSAALDCGGRAAAFLRDRSAAANESGSSRRRTPELRFKWLLILSFLSILSHPALDWLNNYGMRWLMPFRGTWFYGDSVYIMDPWLWVILGFGWLAHRRPSPWLIAAFVFCAAVLAWVVGRRNTQYLVAVAIVAVVLFAALLWRAKREYATAALIVATLYIGARLTIHAMTAMEVRRSMAGVERLMVAAHPIDPTRWDVVAEVGDEYRYGRFTWRDRKLALSDHRIPVAKDSPEWRAAREASTVRGFMNWVRFPWYEVDGNRVLVHDARYATRRRPGGGWGGVEVVISNSPQHK